MNMHEPSSARPRELVSRRTREAIRDTMSGWTLREIDELWQDEQFPPADDPEPVGGQRVTRFQGYLNLVNWTDPGHVARALRVFELSLHPLVLPPDGFNPPETLVLRIRRLLERDGYQWLPDGRITGGPATVIEEGFLAHLTDPDVIREHLDRISNAIEKDDPAQAIGSAKELVESTAKLVLREVGEEVDDRDDVPELVRRAQVALKVHPSAQTPGPDGSDAVKKILGATIAITTGLAELRNRGYGTGHGQSAARKGLGKRHARLALNAAKLWCEFMLDTLSDEQAPWRRNANV